MDQRIERGGFAVVTIKIDCKINHLRLHESTLSRSKPNYLFSSELTDPKQKRIEYKNKIMQARYGENEIKSLLQKVRIFNRDIGTYQLFAITNEFDYTVKVSNGKIFFKIEDLQDDAKDDLTPDRLQMMANRFISSDEKPPSFQSFAIQNEKDIPQSISPKKKNRVGNAMLIIVITIIVLVFGFNYFSKLLNRNSNYSADNSTYSNYEDETVGIKTQTKEEIERSNPANYLSASGTYNRNVWGDKIKIRGTIRNNATTATYKDMVIKVIYLSRTQSVLGSKNFTLYEVINPRSQKSFDLKVPNYKDVNSIKFDVIGATPY